MKIIGTDNHASETVADKLWLDSIPDDLASLSLAKRVCDRLNQRLGDGPGTFYMLVQDDRRLSRGMEDLV
jgi:hypothetical protein